MSEYEAMMRSKTETGWEDEDYDDYQQDYDEGSEEDVDEDYKEADGDDMEEDAFPDYGDEDDASNSRVVGKDGTKKEEL